MRFHYRAALIAAALALLAGGAFAQGMGFGLGVHDARGKGGGTGNPPPVPGAVHVAGADTVIVSNPGNVIIGN